MSWEENYLRDEMCYYAKHKDEAWYDVVQQDRDYCRWLVENNENMNEELRDALSWGIEHVPDRI